MQQDPKAIDDHSKEQQNQQSIQATTENKTDSDENTIFSDLQLQTQESNTFLEEKSLLSQPKYSQTNTLSFNSLLPNDSLLSLLLRQNVTMQEILAHPDFIHTLEQTNNSLIEKICFHMKEIIEFLKVDDLQREERLSTNKTGAENSMQYFSRTQSNLLTHVLYSNNNNTTSLAHHSTEIMSSDCKEISYLFFPPKDKKARKKKRNLMHSAYLMKDELLMGIASPFESDAQFLSPMMTPQEEKQLSLQDNYYTFLEDTTVEPNNQKQISINSSVFKTPLEMKKHSNSVIVKNDFQLGGEECQTISDYLQYFLNLIFEYKASSHSISISYFYQVFLNFFNRDMNEMEHYIYEKIPYFCDKLIQLIDDATILDLILLLLNQPKQASITEVDSQCAMPPDFSSEKDQEDEEFKNQYYYQKKTEIIEGLFDNLSFYRGEEMQQRLSQQSNNTDASPFSAPVNQSEKTKQKSRSSNFDSDCDSDILFWKMKNSSMILCEILDHFQDIRKGEDMGFFILNFHTQKIFQSLSSNNIDEISFNCDVAQHLLAFLQNEEIQFRIEFESIKGNQIVEKYFKESIASIKKELSHAMTKKIDTFNGQFGEKVAMFQAHRLKLIKLLELAFSFKIKDVVQEIFDQEILQIIIILFFQYEWNNQLHMNVMHLFETILDVAQQNDNPSWIFYIIKRVKLVNYIVSNSENVTRRVFGKTSNQSKPLQKSYLGHLKRIAESLIKCIEQNSHYLCWIEDQSKWLELTEMIHKQKSLLKGKLGEDEEAQKQKFQLNCNAKKSLLNRRKKLVEDKKQSQINNNTLSVNNPEVFQRLNSPIKKTITLQVGTPNSKIRRKIEEEEDQRESVSSLQSKKEQQQQQAFQKLQMDSPMLKNKNATPKMNSSSSLSNSSSQLGLRTPKTPLLSTPTRSSQNAPTTPNVKKLILSSPLQKVENQLQTIDNLNTSDSFLESNSSRDNHKKRRGRKIRKRSSMSSDNLSCANTSIDDDSSNSSFSSQSSVESSKSRSSSRGNRKKGWRIKPREVHTYLLKDLDQIGYDDHMQVLTQKHSIKIDGIGFSVLNKKEKKLFDWNQLAEDEEEEERLRERQEENFKNLLLDQINNQNSQTLINLFNLEAAATIQQKRENNKGTLQNKSGEQGQNSLQASPNRNIFNIKNSENYKKNSIDDYTSPKILRDSPFTYGLGKLQTNSPRLKRKNFNLESPCIEVNKQYFRYLIRDTIRKYSYDTYTDQKVKDIQNQSTTQVRSCPQAHKVSKSQFNLDSINPYDPVKSMLPMQRLQKSRDGRLSFDTCFNKLNIQTQTKEFRPEAIQSMDSLKYQKHPKVNSKLIKQVRDNLDISDESSQKSKENLSDEKTTQKIHSDKNLKDFSPSENSSDDERQQNRAAFIGRKNVKKKSTFYQQMQETKINERKIQIHPKIEEEHQTGSTYCVQEANDSSNKSTPFNKKNVFSKGNSEEKILNQNKNEGESYGDLEDTSPPLISDPNRSKKSINSELKIKSGKNNKSNNSVKSNDILKQPQVQQQENEQIHQQLSQQQQSNMLSSTTSILAKFDSLSIQDHGIETYKPYNNEDKIFLNLINGEVECLQRNGVRQLSIANAIFQRNQKNQRSYICKGVTSQLQSPVVQKDMTKSQNFMFNSENIQKKISSSSSSSLLSIPNNIENIKDNNNNNKASSKKIDFNLGKIGFTKSNSNLPQSDEEQEKEESDKDLILKILLKQSINKQKNKTSGSSSSGSSKHIICSNEDLTALSHQ